MPDNSAIGVRGIIGNFYLAYESNIEQWVPDIAYYVKSDQEIETYKWLGQSPAMREWIGGRAAKELKNSGLTIKNRTFEGTLKLNVDDYRRDKTGQTMIRINELASKAADHSASLLTTRIEENGICYDGTNFFAANHSEGLSTTQTNLLTASEVTALNVGTANNPTADEFASAVIGVIGEFYGFKDDQGSFLNKRAKSFCVMVPVNMWANAHIAIGKNNLATGSGLRENPLKSNAFSIDLVVNPELTDDDVFYVFRKDVMVKPFIEQEELPLEVKALGSDSEHAFTNNELLFGIKKIYNIGYGYWQYAIKAQLS